MQKSLQIFFSFLFLLSAYSGIAQIKTSIRINRYLNKGWHTTANDTNKHAYPGFEKTIYNDKKWKLVDVPHNWDDYGGYRRLRNGNRYGYAWYRKKFDVNPLQKDQRCFLWFEGVGSYATVWLNGQKVGYHVGGRTSFILDITNALHPGKSNVLCVRAGEPKDIRDLPWVSGGDSKEIGFCEGSEPLGIFRPVHLIITNQTRIIPFGVHIWNDTTVSKKSATLYLATRIKNYNIHSRPENITVVSLLKDRSGKVVAKKKSALHLSPGIVYRVKQQFTNISHPHLWDLKDPYLYTVKTQIFKDGKCIDQTTTPYGIRWISWPINRPGNNNQFLLNGKQVYINGVADYENMIGQSHALSKFQINTRIDQVEAAGFNAFRASHEPHNLRYQKRLEKDGLLYWPEFTAHIWFDNPQFKKNFKKLLHDWVIERRNNPALILWGLENESTLPTEFAKECSNIIRKLDPTASSQRLIVTCNGGSGTDWDVPQNWSGTYGGDPNKYASEVQQEKLVGEYGAWRSIGLHTEGPFKQNGILSENRMCQLLEKKIRLAHSVKDKFCGQFLWILHSHDNPGRVQNGEGYRALDRVGPVNYKGLFTIWGEPVDAFYLYRSDFVSNKKHPMVYIVSHTWPDRWTSPGIKHNINIYSNCDSVALFNDINDVSLGVRTRTGIGTHFHWDSANIQYNVLYAVGYVNGKPVAKDCIILNHLPKAPHFSKLIDKNNLTKPAKGLKYIYRVNCGGPDYTDENGNLWMADRHWSGSQAWGSVSWTDSYKGMPPFYASQRRTFDPIKGTPDWPLFQTFRYGRKYLKYIFPVPNGDYTVEMYFVEPWYGIGGGMNCKGWRLFDIAVNDSTRIHNLDIWKEAGTDHALKKTLKVHVSNGKIVLSFPKVNSGQAIISAIAIATKNKSVNAAPAAPLLIDSFRLSGNNNKKDWKIKSWLDTGQPQYSDSKTTFSQLPSMLYGAEWLQFPKHFTLTRNNWIAKFKVSRNADVYIGLDSNYTSKPSWMDDYATTNSNVKNDEGDRFLIYHKKFLRGEIVKIGNGLSQHKNESRPFFIAVKYASNITPTYDLKPVQHYSINDAIIHGKGAFHQRLNKKECITFKNNKGDTIEWKIKIGLAGKYSIRFRYSNEDTQAKKLIFYLISKEGIQLQRSKLLFTKTKTGKWNTLNMMTKTAINAGDYKVLLVSGSAKGLSISGLDIQ